MRNANILRLLRGVSIGFALYALAVATSCGGGGGSASSSIGAAGGMVAIMGGPGDGASITVPPNALTTQVNITLMVGGTADNLPAGVTAVGPVIVAGPEGQTFTSYVSIRLPITATATQVVTRPHGGTTWTVVPGAVADPMGGAMIATVNHFSDFVPIAGSLDGGMCMAPNTMCPSGCADLASDSLNCGSCGFACPMAAPCVSGACTHMCTVGQTYCPTTGCTSLTTDPMNCSGCGFACSTGQNCVLGECRAPPMCTTGQTLCAGNCVDLQTDNFNCGMCGDQCLTGGVCTSGTCVGGTGCPSPTVECGSQCIDVTSDPMNCGECGHMCAGTTTCMSGVCM